tara:strand:+ start:112628 stop:113590 length:963 start_codon:yes stop_codon:yes gene_type:complete
MKITSALFAAIALSSTFTFGAGGEAFTDPAKAGPDFAVQGEYEGAIGDKKFGLQLIALGDGKFDGVVLMGGLPGAGWNKGDKTSLKGETVDGITKLTGPNWEAQIENGKLTGTSGLATVLAKKVERKSPSLGAKPPAGATVLFDGSNVDAWESGKLVEEGEHKYLGVEARTKEKFENFTLHLEFRTPYMPKSRGQGRGNSGMYLLDQYECQVLDSFGLEGKDNECGGIYSISKPDLNMCLPPLSWQTYDVEFTAPKFDRDGKRTAAGVATIRLNGVIIHDKRELPKPTPGGRQNDEKPGALFLQNHSNPVVFRNIWIVKK